MYHIAHITPIQEESEVMKNLRSVVEWAGKETEVEQINTVTDLKRIFRKQKFNLICISTKYEPRELLKRISFLAEFCQSQTVIIPLVYELDWEFPLPSILGTRWGGHVGIVHSLSIRSEIMTMLQRMNALDEVVAPTTRRQLQILKKVNRP